MNNLEGKNHTSAYNLIKSILNDYSSDPTSECNTINDLLKLNQNQIDLEVDIINNIIKTAIDHGGDIGGPYFSNKENLIQSIEFWIKFRCMNDSFEVRNYPNGLIKIVRRES